MGSSSSQRINISARIQKLEVDNRFPLRFYFRMADTILRQADIYREEKDILYLYITLIRFASLVCETIPDHQDYIMSDQRERSSWKKLKKKMLSALDELEDLNPAVKQKINELNGGNAYQISRHDHQTCESIPHRSDKKKVKSVTSSSSTGPGNKRFKKETRIKILLEEAQDWQLPAPRKLIPQAHPAINQPTAPPVELEEDLELAKAIDASMQERSPLSDALQIHETNATLSSTSMDAGDLSQHESGQGGDSASEREIHVISTIQASATTDSIPSALPVSDDCPNQHFQCRSTDSTLVKKGESSYSSSCVICLDAPVEGAFIPCGHMVGCMPCLNDIKEKNWDCPVCRAKVEQVIRLYAV